MAEKKLTKFAKMKRTERHSCHSKKKKKNQEYFDEIFFKCTA